MDKSQFKDTYFRNVFVPILLLVLLFIFVFILVAIPIDFTAYTEAAASNSSFLFK